MNEWIEWNEWTKTLEAKTSKTNTPGISFRRKLCFRLFPNSPSQLPVRNVWKVLKIWKMKNFKSSKTKTLKAKTLKTKTPEYLLDESFVFVYFLTVHLSCQCGMPEKCEKFEKWRISKGRKLRPRKLRPRKVWPPNIF